ncbi:hypothetical protein JTE90_028789 [Oedothorax gibbosus]|uniref:Uncharacterized protein n=1 Tax=Oedothorax gibbosus TaxID=931172 RepID=A0AAV6VZP8_9ARAC|nr:hypothetical protein JTE90_028789 [Oedothorax gibbosus]
MEIGRKQNPENKHGNHSESKKGKQLTSIIDQLTINKKKDSAQLDASQQKTLDYKPNQTNQQQPRQSGSMDNLFRFST